MNYLVLAIAWWPVRQTSTIQGQQIHVNVVNKNVIYELIRLANRDEIELVFLLFLCFVCFLSV